MGRKIDLKGQKCGRLTVQSESQKRSKSGSIFWKCRCDCGNIVEVRSHDLLRGLTKSCGCLQRQTVSQTFRKHGMSRSSEYCTWQAMIQRCENPKNSQFVDYGGRGIKVCKSWHKFENFYRDMGDRPKGKSIDRIKNDGNYEFGNCRWATPHEQQMNKRPISKGPFKQRWFRAWRLDQMCQFLSNNQHQFARDHDLDRRNISACLCNVRKSHRGWTFMYCPDPDHFRQGSEASSQQAEGQ